MRNGAGPFRMKDSFQTWFYFLPDQKSPSGGGPAGRSGKVEENVPADAGQRAADSTPGGHGHQRNGKFTLNEGWGDFL